MEAVAAFLGQFPGHRLQDVLAMRIDVAAELLAAAARNARRAMDGRGAGTAAGRGFEGGLELLEPMLKRTGS